MELFIVENNIYSKNVYDMIKSVYRVRDDNESYLAYQLNAGYIYDIFVMSLQFKYFYDDNLTVKFSCRCNENTGIITIYSKDIFVICELLELYTDLKKNQNEICVYCQVKINNNNCNCYKF